MSIKLEAQGRRLRKRRGTAGADGARAAPSQARAGHPQPPRAGGDRGGRGSWPSRDPAPKGQVQGWEKRKPRSWCKGAAGAGVREHPLLEPALELVLDSREQPWARSHARRRLPPARAPTQSPQPFTTSRGHQESRELVLLQRAQGRLPRAQHWAQEGRGAVCPDQTPPAGWPLKWVSLGAGTVQHMAIVRGKSSGNKGYSPNAGALPHRSHWGLPHGSCPPQPPSMGQLGRVPPSGCTCHCPRVTNRHEDQYRAGERPVCTSCATSPPVLLFTP